MESLSETKWDVLISGTGLRQSLLALALSRSSKKVLHTDSNAYYGGNEAAFSLQDIEEWVEKINGNSYPGIFQSASLWKPETGSSNTGPSRSYTLSLSPQLIYTRSRLLSHLVSSKVYTQLEFQAVGSWWMYSAPVSASNDSEKSVPALHRLPSGREDIFRDKSIDLRAKRSLMKFLKFVVDYEAQSEIWMPHRSIGLSEFLYSQFQLPSTLQTVISALTLSLDTPDLTTVEYALPRIARHLTSVGVFGPGFNALMPKWGGNAEITQVACRAGAVGGGTYLLDSDARFSKNSVEVEQVNGQLPVYEATVADDEIVTLTHLVVGSDYSFSGAKVVRKMIAIIASALLFLFQSQHEDAPVPAVSVIVFPAGFLNERVKGKAQSHPVYIMAHSSETGECPQGQCVLHATTHCSSSDASDIEHSQELLEVALSSFLEVATSLLAAEGESPTASPEILYKVSYSQAAGSRGDKGTAYAPDSSLDLAFDDQLLDDVRIQWEAIMATPDRTPPQGDEEPLPPAQFMQFEERPGMNADGGDDDYGGEEY